METINAVEIYNGPKPTIYAKINGSVMVLPKKQWYGRKVKIVSRRLKQLDWHYTTCRGQYEYFVLTPDEIAALPDNILPETEEVLDEKQR